jgi:adenylate cyclase
VAGRTERKLLGALGIGAAIAVAATLVAWGTSSWLLERAELATYDWRVRRTARPSTPSPDIVLVSIDDDSIRRMAGIVGRWPWPRLAHATLIDFLARAPARLVVYDVLFTEPDLRRFFVGEEEWSGAESDQALAEAIRKSGNVILAADAAAEELLDPSKAVHVPLDGIPSLNQPFKAGTCVEARPQLIPPIDGLAKAARAIGHSYGVVDPDGPVRRMVPFVHVAGRDVPSLSVATALLAQKLDASAVAGSSNVLRIGSTAIPLVDQSIPDHYQGPTRACRMLIPFRGPNVTAAGVTTFEGRSFYDLFRSEIQLLQGDKPDVDPSIFRDRIVIVGASASGTYDVFTTPFGTPSPGSEIHANAIDALLRARTLQQVVVIPSGLGATFASALVVGLAGAVVSPWILAGITAAMAGVIIWASLQWFAGGLWTPLVLPLMAVGMTFVGQLAWQYFVEGREKRQVKKLFSRYVPKDVYEQLIDDPARAALGGRRRRMTVLFSDVRGFTALSEKALPEEVVSLLNEYFSRMVQILFEHRGTLDKFVGDMVMGLFGAPLDDEDHAEHAVQAALAMTRELDKLNEEWQAAGRPRLDIGIGIATGDMVAGNIGSDTIMSYTVIGDTVNLGARLESLNKDYGSRIIISEATREALKERYDIRPLGEVVVKGKSRPVTIYEVKRS